MIHKCKICGKEIKNLGLSGLHFKFKHDLTIEKYCLLYDIDYKTKNQKKEEKQKNLINLDDYVECKICGFKASHLVSHINRIHKMKILDYKNKYNAEVYSNNMKANLKEKNSGKNNPFYKAHPNGFDYMTEKEKKEKFGSQKENHPLWGKKHSDESKRKNRETQFGRTLEEIHGKEKAHKVKNQISKSLSELYKSDYGIKLKKYFRLTALKRIEENYGIPYPNYNPSACEIFKKFDERNHTQGRYAIYGDGEYQIKELGYFPDYINFDLKLIIEVDEPYHEKSIQKSKDIDRQKEIQEFYPDFKFLRFKDSEMNKVLELDLCK